ncbi:MAG: helix-turn-helix domain-containing protein [Bacteroidetes bacterium]|nr:helix-turn-helix domain-containing protein [Bacteroidota bacterium]
MRSEISQANVKTQSTSSPTSKIETLLTCDEVLKIFHITRPTLRRWENDQKIIPIRVGRRLLFKESDVQNLTSGKNLGGVNK